MTDLKTPYSTRLCFSGGENRRILDTFKEFGIKHIQLSYYYIARTFHDPADLERYLDGYTTVIIDSGTIYGNLKNENEKAKFLNSYFDFVSNLNKKAYTACVAERGLELENAVPDEALIYPLDDLRETFEDDFQSMCKHIKYIGVSASKMKGNKDSILDRLFLQARQSGTYIHAFATSSRRILSHHPYYSANTSSWRSGSRYLNTYIYEGQGRSLRIYQPSNKKDQVKTTGELERVRKRQRLFIEKRQPELAELIDNSQVLEGDAWEVDKANLTQWIMYQDELGLQPQGKYYLDDFARQEILYRKRELLGKLRNTSQDVNVGMVEEDTVKEKDQEDVEKTETDVTQETTPIVDAEVVESSPVDQMFQRPSTEVAKPVKEYRARLTAVDDRMRQLRQCDMCILSDRCPKYRPEGSCAYGLPPEQPTYDHNRLDEIAEENIADLMAMQMDRIQQAYLQEKLDGTGPSKDLTQMIKTYGELRALAKEAQGGESVKIDARGPGVIDMFKGR